MSDYTGQQFGNYQLVKLLGEGGFAEVYLGEHIYLGKQAAIKVLTTKLTEEGIAQFRIEARIIANLEHMNIVRVLDFGLQGYIPFIVMDYAPNGSLRKRHPRGGRLPLPKVISYVKPVASALQFAHNQKIIHRDIKPDNMLIGRNNEVLLSDFGLAVVAHSSRSLSTETVYGTLYYMAPEQIQGKARIASDQYALGIVVYEWLSGMPPFIGTPMEIGMQHLLTPPPPFQNDVNIPPKVTQVVMKALAKNPDERYQTIMEFAIALEQAAQQPIQQVRSPNVNRAGRPQVSSQPKQKLPLSPQPNKIIQNRMQYAFRGPAPSHSRTLRSRRGNGKAWFFTILSILVIIGAVITGVVVVHNQTLSQNRATLYQSYTNNWKGWVGSSDWKVQDYSLQNNGSRHVMWTAPTIVAPYQVSGIADYAVETDIQVEPNSPSTWDGCFGISVRGNISKDNGWQGYWATFCHINSPTAYIQAISPNLHSSNLAQASFNLESVQSSGSIITYRVEAKGNNIRVFINSKLIIQVADNGFSTGDQVGLASYQTALEISDFNISAI